MCITNAFEIDLEELIRLATEEIEYRPISKYPAVIRDIAIFVPPEHESRGSA